MNELGLSRSSRRCLGALGHEPGPDDDARGDRRPERDGASGSSFKIGTWMYGIIDFLATFLDRRSSRGHQHEVNGSATTSLSPHFPGPDGTASAVAGPVIQLLPCRRSRKEAAGKSPFPSAPSRRPGSQPTTGRVRSSGGGGRGARFVLPPPSVHDHVHSSTRDATTTSFSPTSRTSRVMSGTRARGAGRRRKSSSWTRDTALRVGESGGRHERAKLRRRPDCGTPYISSSIITPSRREWPRLPRVAAPRRARALRRRCARVSRVVDSASLDALDFRGAW